MGYRQYYFIRHALATNDSGAFHMRMLDRDLIEEVDEPLSDEGKFQAAGLGEIIRNLLVERIISSTRRRAEETARIISLGSGIALGGLFDDLAEINFGRCPVNRNILTRLLMSDLWPGPMRRLLDKGLLTPMSAYYFLQWYRGRTIGGESVAEIYDRVNRVLSMLQTLPESRVAIIGHAGWISCLALKIMGSKWDFWKLSRVCNCSFTRVDADGAGAYELKFFALDPQRVNMAEVQPAGAPMRTEP